jgi:hypothetical protein
MESLINRVGLVVGMIGLLLCVVAGIGRVGGNFYLFGYQSVTLLFAGIGMMVAACMFKLYSGTLSR